LDFKKEEWDKSYQKKQNYVFYPNEEIIRFISRYIKKRIGINKYEIKRNMEKCLDLGCGIGRHIIYLDELGFNVFGIDISCEAINFARKWFDYIGKEYLKDKLYIGTSSKMPFNDNYFDFIISHGVLDSMAFDVAKKSISEVYRVLKKGGLFYFDVISGNDYNHPREYEEEEIVESEHEKGTIQSYFNWRKINLMLNGKFEILDCILVQRESVVNLIKNSRYHVIVKKL